ncbi:hypothetical protein [Acetobacter senegalensis]|uniref:hypothetical protein n=1 Tax=Acetobacter senegalensis TaxID=446692 RepID=UPI00128B79A2|nr:hypothetical protein [Acetobacter senegalensis]MPQ73631.1 hypothetical protein [Acetobacter senegalensis]
MVSHALLDLFSLPDGGADGAQTQPGPRLHAAEAPPPVAHDVAGLLREVERLGCRIVLDGTQPVIRGNGAALPPSLLAMLKENRAAIIARLSERAALAEPLSGSITPEHSGIRKDPATGKLHLFGDPSPAWLEKQGWEWNDQRRRFMAPFPQDREDPPPRFIITASPVKTDHRLHADGPCSLCGFTHWWRKAGDTSEGWTCSVCHPPPEGIVTTPPQTLITQNSLDATA